MSLSGLSYIKRNLLCSWQNHFGLTKLNLIYILILDSNLRAQIYMDLFVKKEIKKRKISQPLLSFHRFLLDFFPWPRWLPRRVSLSPCLSLSFSSHGAPPLTPMARACFPHGTRPTSPMAASPWSKLPALLYFELPPTALSYLRPRIQSHL
jgi:hypothetical protein